VKVIIFDFDGTIADTFDAVVEITNDLAEKLDYQPVCLDEVKRLRHLNSREIIQQSRVSMLKLPFLLNQVRAELESRVHSLTPIAGIQESLIILKYQGYRLGIVTSNSQQNVVTFLRNYNLNELFDFVYSGSALFGKSRIMTRLLAKQNISPASNLCWG